LWVRKKGGSGKNHIIPKRDLMVFDNLFLDEKIYRPEKFLKIIISVYKKGGLNEYGKVKNEAGYENDQKRKISVFK
jgi:hypothetical protein